MHANSPFMNQWQELNLGQYIYYNNIAGVRLDFFRVLLNLFLTLYKNSRILDSDM